jgi:thioredoxin reductase (NADPH)
MYDLVIIGAGPAGMTAALYAARYKLKTILLEKMIPGGQIILSDRIENFPGFPGGILTHDLMDKFKEQIRELGVDILQEEVIEIAVNGQAYTVKTDSKSYQAKTVIIASGAQAKQLGVKGEDKFIGRGISYCGTCDGPFFKDKEIIVVGGGDRALEEAIFLTRYAKKVNIIHRRQQFRGSKILEEKARKEAKIKFILNTVIEQIKGTNKVEAVSLKNVQTQEILEMPCDGVFIFVGIKPNTSFLGNLLQINEAGFIITDQAMKTDKPGVFACGDCCTKELYQVINACGEAAVAAHSAHLYLLND